MQKAIGKWCLLVVLALCSLQLFFLLRIVTMLVVDPQSTAFERSEVWRVLRLPDKPLNWQQTWVPYDAVSDHLKRAVIASEDAEFAYHDGVAWDAVKKAWQRNAKAQEQAIKRRGNGKPVDPKIMGASTITQQLVKNLFFSGERTMLRKSQEFVLTFVLEAVLSKQRILEIYLNSVEWGEGVFGAEAAAQRYYRKSAMQLTSFEAARLAVMIPRPKYYEKMLNTTYIQNRAQVIAARMAEVELP